MLTRSLPYLVLTACLLWSCSGGEDARETQLRNDYPYQTVDIRSIRLTDEFWLPRIRTVQEKTIAYALEKCREEGRFDNFLIAGNQLDGTVRGYMPFDDTDVYKIIEGASNSLISAPNPQLDALLDSLIAIIAVGQEEDGYLTTWRTINPAQPPARWVAVENGTRWESLAASHELYNSGHLFEAAAVHYAATGKRNFLDIALKNADLLVKTFGPGKLTAPPGHQIVETGLIKLYRITGNADYLALAKYFLDIRGDSTTHKLYGAYSQDHIPVTEQREAVGHSVRAVYMYAGMTDIAALNRDTAYLDAVHALWDNTVSKKMYITGGIGARHDGESFGDNYELPNLTAYSETCAAIGNVWWNHRLFLLEGGVKYYDIIERTLYNGLISGMSLNGTEFFYPNALESDGQYKFNQGACTRKSWFDCSCCPTNLIRFLPSLPGLIYATREDTLYINLYAASEADIELPTGKVSVTQATAYPWDGRVDVTLDPEEEAEFTVRVRVPGWARNEVAPGNLYQYDDNKTAGWAVEVNGEPVASTASDGYVTVRRTWRAGDNITLNLDMQVRRVIADERVEENRGKVALEYGPLVYAVEEADNPNVDKIVATPDAAYSVESRGSLLEGVKVITGEDKTGSFVAIPYYAWSNRGVGKMKVWLPSAL
ncbi:MAG TPA: beta-L-arabinofuranosidase domain-containing protein [Cyclobacteriaceae bacterium]|nr:beta-L-arabinofuranosidase domain-containing protein [Cyclobacteriaceae bacterium]